MYWGYVWETLENIVDTVYHLGAWSSMGMIDVLQRCTGNNKTVCNTCCEKVVITRTMREINKGPVGSECHERESHTEAKSSLHGEKGRWPREKCVMGP